MTKKDFILIAAALKAARPIPKHEAYALDHYELIARDTHRNAADNVANALHSTNPLFDRARFLIACGVESAPAPFKEIAVESVTVSQRPNDAQIAALRAYAISYAPRWKESLRLAWETGNYHGFAAYPLLQQVRNQFGPAWLVDFRLPR